MMPETLLANTPAAARFVAPRSNYPATPVAAVRSGGMRAYDPRKHVISERPCPVQVFAIAWMQ